MISQPITIFSSSSQSRSASSFRRWSQKSAQSGFAVAPWRRAGLSMELCSSNGHASGAAGDRRDSNPQQPESQSGALPLSYGHQQRVSILVFRTAFANGKPPRDWHAVRSIRARSVLGRCNSTTHMSNLGLLQSMKKIGLILLVGFSFALAPGRLAAQSDDPSEVFLKAYMTSQQGEKLEHDNQLQAALSKFRFAGSLLEELKKTHGDWQPAIVDYRSRKTSENIPRVQGKLGTQKDLAATSNPPPTASNPPMLPTKPGPPDSTMPVTKPPVVLNQAPPPAPASAPVSQPSASVASDAVIKE